jgi:hypothetical protein
VIEEHAVQIRGLTGTRRLEARYEQIVANHRASRIKYRLAACFPRLLVEPDPPDIAKSGCLMFLKI